MKQVQLLQAQLAALESKPASLPAGTTQTNVRLDEGVPQPKLELQKHIVTTELQGADRITTERTTTDRRIVLGE